MSWNLGPGGDAASAGDHLAVLAIHDHKHSHTVNGAEYEHSHRHGHDRDGQHVSSDPQHDHLDQDLQALKPVKAKTVIRRKAAKAGGHDADKIAQVYASAGDEVLIACSNSTGGPPVMLTPADEDEHLIGMTAANSVTGGSTEILSPSELDQAEAELAAGAGGDEFGLSASGDPLAEDTVQGEVFRYSQMAQRDQLRAMGRRGF